MGSGLLSPWHIAIIVLVLLLVFGAKRLPELGRGLGSGMREFKDAVTGHGDKVSDEKTPPAVTAAATAQAPPPAPETPAETPQPVRSD